jgi:hypothetical protein
MTCSRMPFDFDSDSTTPAPAARLLISWISVPGMRSVTPRSLSGPPNALFEQQKGVKGCDVCEQNHQL